MSFTYHILSVVTITDKILHNRTGVKDHSAIRPNFNVAPLSSLYRSLAILELPLRETKLKTKRNRWLLQ